MEHQCWTLRLNALAQDSILNSSPWLRQDVYGAGIAALVRDSYSLVDGKATFRPRAARKPDNFWGRQMCCVYDTNQATVWGIRSVNGVQLGVAAYDVVW